MLEPALCHLLAQIEPAPDKAISAAIGVVLALIGQDWSASRRDEFTFQALRIFREMPGAMVLDALDRARRYVNAGRVLVPWVCADVDPRAARLKLDVDRLTRIAELAVPAA